MDEDALAAVAATAKRAAVMALIAVAVAVIVVFIDNGIKRHVVSKANEAREILDEFVKAAARYGTTQAGETGTPPSNPVDGGDGVVHDAGAGADVGAVANGRGPASRRSTSRVTGGPRGDG